MEKKKKKRSWELRELFIIQVAVAVIMVLVIARFESQHNIEKLILDSQHRQEIEEVEQERDSIQRELDELHELSWENIEYWLQVYEIEHPEIVMAQISVETGSLTSTICLENHNLFGMKEPRVRETTAMGTKRRHAYYENYIESIKDYKLWQDNLYDGGDYYAFLDRVGYAEAEHYIAALKNI